MKDVIMMKPIELGKTRKTRTGHRCLMKNTFRYLKKKWVLKISDGKRKRPKMIALTEESRFLEPSGKRKLVQEIGSSRNRVVKLRCSTDDGKQLLVRVIGRFEKMRVREIGIPL